MYESTITVVCKIDSDVNPLKNARLLSVLSKLMEDTIDRVMTDDYYDFNYMDSVISVDADAELVIDEIKKVAPSDGSV